ncbi:N-acetylmuramoyl-L-alanine amidase [Lachnospiraceae bacterium TWA4]|nr:N-acetylmuramoyl-L-alanine amidase [Lachnospiraceae bacterium TWA4]
MAYTIFMDAGHGGLDPGAVYKERNEKDDTLKLTLSVGKLLSDAGINVIYSRDEDRYDTPFEKAMLGNDSEADLFVSIHRNAIEIPGTASGVETLVYSNQGLPSRLAKAINANLEEVGFVNRGIIERPNLVVLRRTRMPAILIEVGFIDSEIDNDLFDSKFNEISQAIANGILETIDLPVTADEITQPDETNCLYRVQTGAFRNGYYAKELLSQLLQDGYPAFILQVDGLYKVQVGAYKNLENAIRMEKNLRQAGYETYITV